MENSYFKNTGLSEGKLIKNSTQTGQFGEVRKKNNFGPYHLNYLSNYGSSFLSPSLPLFFFLTSKFL